MPRLTLLTATFNSAKTVGDTMRSVARQTFRDVEHLVLDGGSKDDTLDVVRREGVHGPTIVSQPDKGFYDACNKGIARAQGDVIGFINSDDFYVHDGVLERAMAHFDDPAVEGVHADLVYVDPVDPSQIVRHWRSRAPTARSLRRGFIPAHPTVFLRRSVYDRVGAFDLRYPLAADYDFLLRVFQVEKIAAVYVPEIWIRMRTGGATGGSLADIRRQNDEILDARRRHGIRYPAALFFAHKLADRALQRARARFVNLPAPETAA